MNRKLTLEFVRITETAAIACSAQMGRGNEKEADQLAVNAMRNAFNKISLDGEIVIGEGERDKAPMLYIGEKVGAKDPEAPQVDIALDPLEGTRLCAHGKEGALSVMAVAPKGSLLKAPDVYMKKIACGPQAKGKIDISRPVLENLQAVSQALNKNLSQLNVVILERPRHEKLIAELREAGVRIRLITDGDVSAGIATCWENSGVDLLLGTGGAPEGVLTAAALKCLEGDFQGQLIFQREEEEERALKMGLKDLEKIYSIEEIVKKDVLFSATGVTDSSLLKGVRTLPQNKIKTHSVVMRSATGTIRYVETEHDLAKKPV